MKILQGCLSLVVSAAALLLSPVSLQADASAFHIGLIKEANSRELILVDREWRKDLPKRMQVSLKVSESRPSAGLLVKAYFYDKDLNLIYTAPKPNAIWTDTKRGFSEVLLPAQIDKGKPFDVYFALAEKVTQGKWKTMVVVFGEGDKLVARSRPANMLSKVEFPEKVHVVEDKESTPW